MASKLSRSFSEPYKDPLSAASSVSLISTTHFGDDHPHLLAHAHPSLRLGPGRHSVFNLRRVQSALPSQVPRPSLPILPHTEMENHTPGIMQVLRLAEQTPRSHFTAQKYASSWRVVVTNNVALYLYCQKSVIVRICDRNHQCMHSSCSAVTFESFCDQHVCVFVVDCKESLFYVWSS